MEIVIIVLVIFLIILAAKSVKIVPEGYEWIVEDLERKRDITLKMRGSRNQEIIYLDKE